MGPTDPRWLSTLKAVGDRLLDDSLVYRDRYHSRGTASAATVDTFRSWMRPPRRSYWSASTTARSPGIRDRAPAELRSRAAGVEHLLHRQRAEENCSGSARHWREEANVFRDWMNAHGAKAIIVRPDHMAFAGLTRTSELMPALDALKAFSVRPHCSPEFGPVKPSGHLTTHARRANSR